MRLFQFCFLVNIVISIQAQNQINNWFFGDSLMMNFVGSTITANQIEAPNLLPIQEASASISDHDGNLLFYTDGKYVWNRNNEVMPNGCCLDIDKYWDFASSVSQGVIILQRPGYENEYVIAILSEAGFSYNIIDISLDSEYGDVVIKNEVLISNDLTEQMHAVKHANGRDWWVLVHEQLNDPDSSALFYKILLSPDTIQVSSQEAGIKREGNHLGQMVFSPNGERLAYADKNGLEIFYFDRCTGGLEEMYFIPIEEIAEDNLYGCAFSSDGNKLFVTSIVYDNYSILFQYCFNCNDPFPETKKLIYELIVEYYMLYPKYSFGQLQLGPDGKIYIAVGPTILPSDDFSEFTTNLSVIKSPNVEIACDVDTNSISLDGRRTILGLPNFPNYSLGALTGSGCDTLTATYSIENNNTFSIYPNPAKTFINITSHLTSYAYTKAEIYNTAGAKVKEVLLNSPVQEISIETLPCGIYALCIKQKENAVFSRSFVKE